jgi:hypothetical protein
MAIKIIKRITINGVDYDSPDQIPPELRTVYEQAQQRMKVKDVRVVSVNLSANRDRPLVSPGTVSDATGSVEPERSSFRWLWMAVVIATLVSYGLYFYLRAR